MAHGLLHVRACVGAPSVTCSADQGTVVDGGPAPAMTVLSDCAPLEAFIPHRALTMTIVEPRSGSRSRRGAVRAEGIQVRI